MKTMKVQLLIVAMLSIFAGKGWGYSYHVDGGQLTVRTDVITGSGGAVMYPSSDLEFNIGEKITEYVTAAIASLASSHSFTTICNTKSRFADCKIAIRFANGYSTKNDASGSPNALDIIQYNNDEIGIHVGNTFTETYNTIRLYTTANENTVLRFDYIVGILVKYCLATDMRLTPLTNDFSIRISESGTGDAIVYTLDTDNFTR